MADCNEKKESAPSEIMKKAEEFLASKRKIFLWGGVDDERLNDVECQSFGVERVAVGYERQRLDVEQRVLEGCDGKALVQAQPSVFKAGGVDAAAVHNLNLVREVLPIDGQIDLFAWRGGGFYVELCLVAYGYGNGVQAGGNYDCKNKVQHLNSCFSERT